MRCLRRSLTLGFVSFLAVVSAALGSGPATADDPAKVVNVYTARLTAADAQLYQLFTQKTGIKVSATQGKPKELLQRIKLAGGSSDADIFLTLDATDLLLATEYKVLQPIASTELTASIPATMRDPQNHWFAFSSRARLIVYDKTKVKLSKLSTYEALADARWQSQILTRSSTADDVQQLVAAMIDADGQDQVDAWTKGIVQNLGRRPQGTDGDQITGMIGGNGTIAICSSDKFARLLQTKDATVKQALTHIGVFFPNQQDRGVHIDLAGGGVVIHAPHLANATKFLEFMASPEAQRLLADVNFVYPVRAGVAPSSTVAAWGDFKADDPRIAAVVRNTPAAINLLNRAGWQ